MSDAPAKRERVAIVPPAVLSEGKNDDGRALPGPWSRVSGNAAKLYVVLAWHAGNDRRCWPGQETLAALVGVHVKRVPLLANELVRAGIVTIERGGGGRHKPTIYRVETPAFALPNEDEKPPRERYPSGGGNPPESAPKPPRQRSETPAFAHQNPRANRGGTIAGTEARTEAENTAAAGADDSAPSVDTTAAAGDALRDALSEAGVDGHLVTKALAIEGISDMPPSIIRDVGQRCREQGKGAPIVVLEIEKAAGVIQARRRRHAAESRPANSGDTPAPPVSDAERREGWASVIAGFRRGTKALTADEMRAHGMLPPSASEQRRAARIAREFPGSTEVPIG